MQSYERDLDLNLLRVFVVVAEEQSITAAASRLYLTQPAISAAMRRLTEAVGAPLLAKRGRGVVLSARGRALYDTARPHLEALVAAARATPRFDPATTERTVRLGLADSAEGWLLPALHRVLAERARALRIVALPVNFRTVGEAMHRGRVDLAVTVADELPAGLSRRPLLRGEFVVLHDPRHTTLGRRPSRARYLEHEHVIVSYAGDLRGIVEDALGERRKIRLSVPSFQHVGAVVSGTATVATVPTSVADSVLRERAELDVAPLPFELPTQATELLVRDASSDDGAVAFVVDEIVRIARDVPVSLAALRRATTKAARRVARRG
ncbi:MAG: LysR family transcriptional regulator [Sandaracinus sp.]|nr:LysR family transcriptional regulator [Sandaracinus sp.]MCB9604865.1 LysR family transcriptional regulator [Sandaracinus sp.]